MKVEFYSKYGIVCEFAKLTNTSMMVLISGAFADPSYWTFLDPLPTEGDTPIGVMLATTGMVVGQFDQLSDIDGWIGNAQKTMAEAEYTHVALMVSVINNKGEVLEEGLIQDFPTTYSKTTGATP